MECRPSLCRVKGTQSPFFVPGLGFQGTGSRNVLDLKGLLSWRQWPEVPSEKPKHKNNSMSKNKIPSSEVPGPGPSLWQALPLSLAHGGARQPRSYPGTERSGGHARPRVATAGTACPERSRSPRGGCPHLAKPDKKRCPRVYPLPSCPLRSPVIRPERKCTDRAGPPWLRSGSAPPPPLRLAPRSRARLVPDCPV